MPLKFALFRLCQYTLKFAEVMQHATGVFDDGGILLQMPQQGLDRLQPFSGFEPLHARQLHARGNLSCEKIFGFLTAHAEEGHEGPHSKLPGQFGKLRLCTAKGLTVHEWIEISRLLLELDVKCYPHDAPLILGATASHAQQIESKISLERSLFNSNLGAEKIQHNSKKKSLSCERLFLLRAGD